LRALTITPGGLITLGNVMSGEGYGAEIWADYDATSWWRLSFGANWLEKNLVLGPTAIAAALDQHQGNDPDFQLQLRSQMTIRDNVTFDAALRAVDDLENPGIPGYIEADMRL